MGYQTSGDRKYPNKKKDRENEKESPITLIEIFKLVCVQFGIVTPQYFLDVMQPYELSIICDGLHLRQKDSWEQARLIAYVIAQVNSTKKLNPTDIITFDWDKKEKKSSSLTVDDVEKIKAMALQREEKLKELGII
jgi:hypothetical protein